MTKLNRKKTIILATHSSLPHACLTGIGCKTQDSHREEADAQGLQGFCQLLWRLSCILIDILGRSQDIHRLNGRYTTQSDKFCLAYTMCFLASHSIFHDIGTHQGNLKLISYGKIPVFPRKIPSKPAMLVIARACTAYDKLYLRGFQP